MEHYPQTGKKSVRFSSPFETPTASPDFLAKFHQQHNQKFPSSSSTNKKAQPSSKSSTKSTTISTKENIQPIHSSPKDFLSNSNTSPFSGDSWDAFDAKMLKSSNTTNKVESHRQFLELSALESQNRSLANHEDSNVGRGSDDAEGFSAMSFQDAMAIIDKDENERLQFMNSKNFTSVDEGLEQMEAPSLLSLTDYFQQNSSFPVPYTGNDSTMMFGNIPFPGFPPSHFQDPKQTQSSRRSSSNSHQGPDNDLHRRSSSRTNSSTTTNSRRSSDSTSTATTVRVRGSSASTSTGSRGSISMSTSELGGEGLGTEDQSLIQRSDSLQTFFLGPNSDGMNKFNIIDHVMDYCKRRASFRDSDTSLTFLNATPRQHPQKKNEISVNKHKKETDSIRELEKEKMVMDNVEDNWSSKTCETRSNLEKESNDDILKLPEKVNKTNSTRVEAIGNNKEELGEASIILSDATFFNDKPFTFLDMSESDIGGTESFEKFTKNLRSRQEFKGGADRYHQMKMKGREEFERKRMQIDEKYSHPKLSPRALSGPGSTASLQRPKTTVLCNSPPEKLVTPRNERFRDKQILGSLQELGTPKASTDGQCQSTPITAESFLQQFMTNGRTVVAPSKNPKTVEANGRIREQLDLSKTTSTTPAVRTDTNKDDNNVEQKKQRKMDLSSSSSSTTLTRGTTVVGSSSERRYSSNTYPRRVKSPVSTRSSKDISNETELLKVSKDANNASNYAPKPTNQPPQTLPLGPASSAPPTTGAAGSFVVSSTTSQTQQFPFQLPIPQQFMGQYNPTASTCSCSHQGHAGAMPQGIPGMPQGMPIVIHIHLPCSNAMNGTGVHSIVSTPSTEAPK